MTSNQINHEKNMIEAAGLEETKRANKAREGETKRSDLAREALERLSQKETRRSHRRSESLTRKQIQETRRSNKRMERLKHESNKVSSKQSRRNLKVGMANVALGREKAYLDAATRENVAKIGKSASITSAKIGKSSALQTTKLGNIGKLNVQMLSGKNLKDVAKIKAKSDQKIAHNRNVKDKYISRKTLKNARALQKKQYHYNVHEAHRTGKTSANLGKAFRDAISGVKDIKDIATPSLSSGSISSILKLIG